MRIASSTEVAVPPATVFAFLIQRQNHWLLSGPKIELLELAESPEGHFGAQVLLRGPLRLRRHARTRIDTVREPWFLGGTVELGDHTTVHVGWHLRPANGNETRVVLSALPATLSRLDALLFLAGGTIWTRRLLASTLELLSNQLDPHRRSGRSR
jgi:hypothetical protein